mmetsp:Transcript_21731/g.65950  ORF Transcript_21731/g.65950 Transcript_21731/m.65950 type:complete len:520 (-) Transcript_21731:345-1904(-)
MANPAVSALQATLSKGIAAPGVMMAPASSMAPALPACPAPASSAESGASTALAAGAVRADGKKGARDFSFLVTEDKQESGPNLAMLGCSDDDSDSDPDSDDEAPVEEGEGEDGFEAGSAIDQLLWRQKAVSGMETRRPGESVQQFFQRRMAGMRMLKAEAGTSSAKQLENEVDQALMNASTAWHWGKGDHDADISDDETDLLRLEDSSSDVPLLTYKLESDGPAPPPPPDEAGALIVQHVEGGAPGNALVAYDGAKAAAKRRQIIGSEAVRASAALVPRASKDCLSNEKLAPVESGRGFALLEKMGWKKGEGLGRSKTGTTLPVAAMVKTDMGGLASSEEKYRAPVRVMDADGPQLSDNFSVGASGMLAQAKAASMDSEFSSIVSQTKSVQQINEENRRLAAGGGSAPSAAPSAPQSVPSIPGPPPMPPPPTSAPPLPGAYPAPAPASYPPPPSYPSPPVYPPPPTYGYPPQGAMCYGYGSSPMYTSPIPGYPPMPGYPPVHPAYMAPGMAQQHPWGWG